MGAAAAVPAEIVKFVFETSKKMFPTASTFIRAVVGRRCSGASRPRSRRSACSPRARYGYVWPPSVESEISTFAVRDGRDVRARLVPRDRLLSSRGGYVTAGVRAR